MTTSDAALLAAADPDAFRELYARYAERVYGYFVRRSGDHARFDLTAETFAQAWIMRRRFRDEAAGCSTRCPRRSARPCGCASSISSSTTRWLWRSARP